MFLFLDSPSFWLVAFYIVTLINALATSDFYSFWALIEVASLILFAYIYFSVDTLYMSTMIFYSMQATASIGLLISYTFIECTGPYLFVLFLFINIGIFPFNFWYFYSIFDFPRTPLFITLTFHNLFSVYLVTFYVYYPNIITILTPFIIATLITSSFIVAQSPSLLSVIIVSSIFNNVWIFLSCWISFLLFVIYFTLYALLSYFLIYYPKPFYTSVVFFSLMGFPPFPLFFVNIVVLYSLLLTGVSIWVLFTLILTNVALIALYYNYASFSLNSIYTNSLYINN